MTERKALKEWCEAKRGRKLRLAKHLRVPASYITYYLDGSYEVDPYTAAEMSIFTGREVSVRDILYPEGLPEEARLGDEELLRRRIDQLEAELRVVHQVAGELSKAVTEQMPNHHHIDVVRLALDYLREHPVSEA